MFLRSRLLESHGFLHGFSQRTGGVSEGCFESLNLGRGIGDEPNRVEENHQRFAKSVGFDPATLYEVSQVHGTDVRFVQDGDHPIEFRRQEADSVITTGGFTVGIRTADCVPILLADRTGGAVAAVHAGWRGAVAGVVGHAVSLLCARAGGQPSDLVAAIGPHIRVESFEVGPEVAEQLARVAGDDVVHRSHARPHVDLSATTRRLLVAAGLAGEAVEDIGGCTYREPAQYFSYRRDTPESGRTGRQLSVIRGRSS